MTSPGGTVRPKPNLSLSHLSSVTPPPPSRSPAWPLVYDTDTWQQSAARIAGMSLGGVDRDFPPTLGWNVQLSHKAARKEKEAMNEQNRVYFRGSIRFIESLVLSVSLPDAPKSALVNIIFYLSFQWWTPANGQNIANTDCMCFENLFFSFSSRSVDVLAVIISRWMLAADRVGALCCSIIHAWDCKLALPLYGGVCSCRRKDWQGFFELRAVRYLQLF